jgi:Arm DNA-binding domain
MLSAKKIERGCKEPGRYLDKGGAPGLMLQVSKSGARSWILRYQLDHKERMMGLGSVKTFTLKQARERARSARQLLADGHDPLAAKASAQALAQFRVACQTWLPKIVVESDRQKARQLVINLVLGGVTA